MNGLMRVELQNYKNPVPIKFFCQCKHGFQSRFKQSLPFKRTFGPQSKAVSYAQKLPTGLTWDFPDVTLACKEY